MEPWINSTDDISKKMESMSLTTTQRVIRRNKRVPKPPRFCPFPSWANDVSYDEQPKQEAVRFGVKLSVLVAEAMFLFSEDIRSVLCFCFLIFKRAGNQQGLMVKRLLSVMEHVFAKYIKPKNGVYKDGGKTIHWKQINKFQQDFTLGFKCLDNCIRSIHGTGGLKNMYFFKRCILLKTKNLEDMLKSVNEANGFPREAIEFSILHFWKDLFETTNPGIKTFFELRQALRRELREVFNKSEDEDVLKASGLVEEALETTIPRLWKSLSETTPQVINQPRITTYPELFRPLIDECKRYNGFVRELSSLSL